jgi:hypothetical protein
MLSFGLKFSKVVSKSNVIIEVFLILQTEEANNIEFRAEFIKSYEQIQCNY